MKQNKNKTNINKKKEQSTNLNKFNIFAFGFLDLTFIIEFNDKEISQIKDGKTIQDINNENLELLEFIKDNQDLINRIKLQSENDSLNEFILLNRISIGNRQIEYFPFRSPKFKGKCEFFKNIFDTVLKKNGILVNKYSLDKNQEYSIKIKLIYKSNNHTFEYTEKDRESDNPICQEHTQINNNKVEENKEDDNENDEDNLWVKNGLIPKFKRKGCMLSNLKPNCGKYDLIYINYNDLQNVKGDFEEEDFIELMKFFKDKKSKIFINYYMPEKSDLVEPPEDDEENLDDDDEEEKEDNDENKESNNENKEEDSNENKSKNNTKFTKQKSIKILYNLSDIYFFDEKQAYQLFNKHLKYNRTKNSKNTLNKANIYDYFISSIAGNTNNTGEKIGLFLNDLEKFTIVFCSNKKGSKETLDSKLYPKATTRNLEMINEYKALIQEDKDEYYSIFFTFMLGAFSSNNKNLGEEIYSAFANALNIMKKKLECNKNNIEFTTIKSIDYKTIEKYAQDNKHKYAQKGKEKQFVLDCMNVTQSKLKEYLPLKDKNLRYYLQTNKDYLVQKGFVDQKGYIMYDKEYRRSLGSPVRYKYNNNSDSNNMTKIINDLSMKSFYLQSPNKTIFNKSIRTGFKLPLQVKK